jgi:hypothetical protein
LALRRVEELQSDAELGILSEACLPLEVANTLKDDLDVPPDESPRADLITWCDSLKFLELIQAGMPWEMNRIIDQKLLRRSFEVASKATTREQL